ncbi:Thiamine-monophosphate kinase [termite gut metagenome]|uniref:Thiamine-monophosphate kinase n=1 Tax=termite gut metagenome TaxID=433724 RepID=A0A5J4RUG4_9ZZZZ
MKHIDPDIFHFWINNYIGSNYYSRYKHIEAGINQDDCAIINLKNGEKIVITTDYLNANPIALELKIGNFYDLGRITVASNISDLCGTGAKPIGFLLGISSNKETNQEDIYDFVKGAKYELDKIKVPLIGGDTKLGKSNVFYGVAVGYADSKMKLYPKNSAKKNDILWVTGKIGSLSASVHGLSLNWGNQNWINWAKKTIINPIIPIKLSNQLSLKKIANGGTDLSDGLGADLKGLCRSSNLGVLINANNIPLDNNVLKLAVHLAIPEWFYSFIIGGDFQFIVSTNKKYRTQMQELGFFEIGVLKEFSYGLKIQHKSRIIDMPDFGHKDDRKMSFKEEVSYLLEKLKINCNEN